MTQVQDGLKIQGEYVTQLLARVTAEYAALTPELTQIAKQYPGSDDEFSFLEEFELWISNICGYAQQIQAAGGVRQGDAAIAHLQQLQFSANPIFVRFYADGRERYTKVGAYLQSLDYLRLLALEYLQMQRSSQPVSA
jgi:hypothetical protein